MTMGPLTALVGPNAAGKSTVLRALNPAQTLLEGTFWRHDTKLSITLRGEPTSGGTFGRGQGTGSWHPLRYQLARLDVERLRQPNTLSPVSALDEIGSDLANAFGTLTRKQKESIAGKLKTLVPVFGDVDLIPHGGGQHIFRFQDRWDDKLWYSPSEVSDGSMLMLAYLVLQHQDPPPQLLCIEEPDRGLHPYLLGELIALFRKMSAGELGRPVQIVLATHSADLLNHLRPEEVRFLTRDSADGAVTVEQVDVGAPDWKSTFQEYKESLGNVWLSGGVGGVP